MDKKSALNRQVGGSHYKDYKIQPYEFFIANKIPHHKAAIIRRILRYDHPTGKGVQDLDKILHEIELIKELDPALKVHQEIEADGYQTDGEKRNDDIV